MTEETQPKKKMKMPTPGPKTRKSAETVTGATALILGWVVGDILGYPMPDAILQSFTIILMVIGARISEFVSTR